MQTQALSSRLSFRSQPLGTISFDSPLQPAVILENLRARGREWRESAIPEDLRKHKVGNLLVEIEGAQFKMRWTAPNPFYNPMCFGTVQPYRDGSRIRAGFRVNPQDFVFVGCLVAVALLQILGERSTFTWVLSGLMAICLIPIVARNRSAEPMRARLIEVLHTAAQQAPKQNTPLLG